MIKKLNATETDFLGDLCQSEHDLWEIFGFVRLHQPGLQDTEVLRVGVEMILRFSAEVGWKR
jgi:hypothetical protein